MTNVLEYWIRAKDATSEAIQSAIDRVKRLSSQVNASMEKVKKAFQKPSEASERFIKTTAVLDSVGRALDKCGIEGQQFNDVYDTLEKRLNEFNRTGEGSAELFEHFRHSMADVGMSAKQIDNGIAMLKRNMVGMGESGKDVAKTIRTDFRGIHTVTQALTGNVFAAGRAFTWLLGHIKKLNLSANALSGISIGVFALTELVSKAVGWWKEKRQRLEEIQNLKFEDTLKDVADAQKDVNRELRDEERRISDNVEKKKALIEQNRKLMEQEIELARIEALSGKTGAERDEINRDFDAQRAALKAKTDIEKAQAEAEGQNATAEMIAGLEARLAPHKARMEAQMKALDAEVKAKEAEAYKRAQSEKIYYSTTGMSHMLGTMGEGGGYRDPTQQEVSERYNTWRAEDEEYRNLREKRDRLQDQYNGIVDDMNDFDRKREKAASKGIQLENDIGNIQTDYELDIWRSQEEEMNAYYEDLARYEAEAAREAERNAEKQRRLERQFHNERLREAQDEINETKRQEGEAERRLSAAQSQVKEAWGWYRDKSQMKAQIDEFKAQQAAETQWAKDFEKLKSRRRDWRDIEFGQLSAEEEAVRQVALAKEEEAAAQEALNELVKQGEQQTEALLAIQQELTGEEEA